MTKKATMKKVDKNGRKLRLYPYFVAIPPFSMMKKVDKNGRIVKAVSPITLLFCPFFINEIILSLYPTEHT